ncbi:tautomerase family protein [Oleispirillum naphthae]|uniref:tautomerase family protein n=1 Tax=Oleispirillum naphthae TaxID=2838853 RepID=UPI003082668B
MPTYTVTAANLTLTAAQEADLAAAVTQAHHATTGAPAFFAQVRFAPVAEGRHYIGGKPNTAPHLFVHGLIRDGRSSETKTALVQEIAAQAAAIARLSPEDVWVYVQDIPAEQMVEFGRVLPAPGEEAQWRQGIGAAKRQALAAAGVRV